MTREQVIAALLEAKCGSYELDVQIAAYIGYDDKGAFQMVLVDPFGKSDEMKPRRSLPQWSTDLTTATALASPDMIWTVAKYPTNAMAWVGPRDDPFRQYTVAATPALALSAASLRVWKTPNEA